MQTQPNSTTATQSSVYRHLSYKLLLRSWWRQWIYPSLFLLAMVLSLSTYLTLDSIEQSVEQYVSDNQRALVGGDLIVSSKQAWPTDLVTTIDNMRALTSVYDYQFNAMIARSESTSMDDEQHEQTLLARIKAVSEEYPLYGEVMLASGQPLWARLTPQTVVVETQVLTRMGLAIGDRIQIGEATFTIADELVTEPDRPLTAFGFGARVLMDAKDLPTTNLLGQRSRVNYRIELAGSKDALATAHSQLTTLIDKRTNDVTLTTANETDTSISAISSNVLMFLKLLVIAVVFLAGVALHGVTKAFVNGQQTTNAIRRALGESVASIKRSYYAIILAVGAMACVMSVLLSIVMLEGSKDALTAILPADMVLSIKLTSVVKISVIALVISLLVTYHSLQRMLSIKPWVLLQQSNTPVRQSTPWWWYVWVVLACLGLLVWEFTTLASALQILLGMMGLIGCLWLIEKAWLWLLQILSYFTQSRLKSGWMLRIAVHNLSRKGNQTALFFITIGLSIAVLSMVSLLNHSLHKQFIQAYPEDAPNLFMLDIQAHQHEALNAIVDTPIQYYPVVRARVTAVNDTPVTDIKVSKTEGDDPTRVFNLSYRETVMDTEFIQSSVKANELYSPVGTEHNTTELETSGRTTSEGDEVDEKQAVGQSIVAMSILDSAADLFGAELGDRIHFNIQGITLVGQITSIRERYERGPTPFFYFLFEPHVLAKAPQLQFATAKVDAASITKLQTKLARDMPAITTINGGMIAQKVQSYVAQMQQLIQIFTLLTIMTGLIVLLTSLLATSQDRLRDSASFRLLGMKTTDLYRINLLEIGLLGMSAALFALVAAIITSYALIVYWFDIQFNVPWGQFAVGAFLWLMVLVVIAIGYVRLVIGKGIMTRVRQMI